MKKILFSAALSAALLSGTALYAQTTSPTNNSATGGTVSGSTESGTVVETPAAGAEVEVDADVTAAVSAEDSMLGSFFTDDTRTAAIAEADMAAAFTALSAEDQQAAIAECNQISALQEAESPGENNAEFEAQATVCEAILAM